MLRSLHNGDLVSLVHSGKGEVSCACDATNRLDAILLLIVRCSILRCDRLLDRLCSQITVFFGGVVWAINMAIKTVSETLHSTKERYLFRLRSVFDLHD